MFSISQVSGCTFVSNCISRSGGVRSTEHSFQRESECSGQHRCSALGVQRRPHLANTSMVSPHYPAIFLTSPTMRTNIARARTIAPNRSSSPTRFRPLRQTGHRIRISLSQSTAKATCPASAKPSASQTEPWKRRRWPRIARRERTRWRATGEDGFVASRG
jgi:hypothetical protein